MFKGVSEEKNIARIAKHCPENISPVVEVSSVFFAKCVIITDITRAIVTTVTITTLITVMSTTVTTVLIKNVFGEKSMIGKNDCLRNFFC